MLVLQLVVVQCPERATDQTSLLPNQQWLEYISDKADKHHGLESGALSHRDLGRHLQEGNLHGSELFASSLHVVADQKALVPLACSTANTARKNIEVHIVFLARLCMQCMLVIRFNLADMTDSLLAKYRLHIQIK